MLLQVEEIERRREENSRVNALPSMPPPSPPPTATHSTAPSWAMRGKLQGKGRTDKRTTRSLRARRLLRLAAADTDQNTAHFRQSGEKQCVLWNACTKHHAGKRHGGRKGRKLVYECVQVAPSQQHKINGFNAGAATPASESQGRRRPSGEDFSRAKSFNY